MDSWVFTLFHEGEISTIMIYFLARIVLTAAMASSFKVAPVSFQCASNNF